MGVRSASRLYRSFRERRPQIARHVTIKLPKAVAVIGYAEFIGYSTTHGHKATLYRHDFSPGSRPLLVAGTKRGELYLIGGRYKFTGRGITDLDRRNREIDD